VSAGREAVAAFDVDGTLTWTDSFVLFLRFVAGDLGFAAGMAGLAPVLAAHTLGVVSRHQAKEAVVRRFLGGMDAGRYRDLCAHFGEAAYPLIARADGLQRLEAHRGVGDTVALVSASLADYLKVWSNQIGGPDVLATEVEVAGGRLTGALAGQNCWGPEKLARVRTRWPTARLVAAYGDSRGDREMLAAADRPGYRLFHDRPQDAGERIRSILSGR
jgi:phosphatidylglycerophosphatase C